MSSRGFLPSKNQSVCSLPCDCQVELTYVTSRDFGKLHVIYLLDPHVRNSWENICRVIFDSKRLHHFICAFFTAAKGRDGFGWELWGKSGQKHWQGVHQSGRRSSKRTQLAFRSVDHRFWPISDPWQWRVNHGVELLEAWPLLATFLAEGLRLKLRIGSLFSFYFLGSHGNFRMLLAALSRDRG